MAFFLRPSPFSFNVFSPALSMSASVAPSSWAARAAVWSVDAANTASTTAQLSILTTELFMRVSSWVNRWLSLPSVRNRISAALRRV
jgi:hypothetical protein